MPSAKKNIARHALAISRAALEQLRDLRIHARYYFTPSVTLPITSVSAPAPDPVTAQSNEIDVFRCSGLHFADANLQLLMLCHGHAG